MRQLLHRVVMVVIAVPAPAAAVTVVIVPAPAAAVIVVVPATPAAVIIVVPAPAAAVIIVVPATSMPMVVIVVQRRWCFFFCSGAWLVTCLAQTLDYWQAQTKARECMAQRTRDAFGSPGGQLTIKQAIDLYLAFKEGEGRDTTDARCRAALHILPALGDRECASLATEDFRSWLRALAHQHARVRSKKTSNKVQYRKVDGDEKEVSRRRQASANRVWTILRATLNHAFNQGKIYSDAVAQGEAVQGRERGTAALPEHGSTRRLINSCDSDFRPLVRPRW